MSIYASDQHRITTDDSLPVQNKWNIVLLEAAQ